MYRRLNVSLRRETVGLLDRLTTKGDRSRFIDVAIRRTARELSRARLRRLLEEDGRVNRDRDLAMVEEWAAVDAETWRGADMR